MVPHVHAGHVPLCPGCRRSAPGGGDRLSLCRSALRLRLRLRLGAVSLSPAASRSSAGDRLRVMGSVRITRGNVRVPASSSMVTHRSLRIVLRT